MFKSTCCSSEAWCLIFVHTWWLTTRVILVLRDLLASTGSTCSETIHIKLNFGQRGENFSLNSARSIYSSLAEQAKLGSVWLRLSSLLYLFLKEERCCLCYFPWGVQLELSSFWTPSTSTGFTLLTFTSLVLLWIICSTLGFAPESYNFLFEFWLMIVREMDSFKIFAEVVS